MANTIKLKTSAIQGKSPLVGDLQISEFAWNSYDGKLYGKKNDGTASIIEIGGGGGGATSLDGLSDVAITSPLKGQFIAHNGTEFINTRTIETSGAAVTPLIVKGAASQTANLVDVQNSSGTVLSAIDSAGNLAIGTSAIDANRPITISGSNSGIVGISIKNISTNQYSQTGIEFKSSTQTTGYLFINQAGAAATHHGGPNAFNLVSVAPMLFQINGEKARFDSTGKLGINTHISGVGSIDAMIQANTSSAATKGVIVKGSASQTANSIEAQTSAGTALFYVNVDNGLTANGTTSAMFVQSGTNNRPTAIFRKSVAPNFGFIEFQDSAGSAGAGVLPSFTIYTGGAQLSGSSGFQLYANGGLGSAGIRSNSGGGALSIGGNIAPSDDCTLYIATQASFQSQRGLVVQQRNAGPNANLLELKNSVGTNVCSVYANGDTFHTSTATAGVPLAITRPASPTNYGFVVRHSNGKRMFGVGANASLAGEIAGWGSYLEMGNDDYAMIRLGYHTSTGAFRILSNTDTIQSWESPAGAAGVYHLALARNTTTTSWNFSLAGFATSVRFETTVHANRFIEQSANAFNTSLAPSTGTLTVNTSLSNAVLGTLSASVTTWAFTNVPTDNSKVTTITAVLAGNASYTYGDACSVNGTAVTDGVMWSGGSAPTATAGTDIITFIIVRDSAGTVKVYGSATTNFS